MRPACEALRTSVGDPDCDRTFCWGLRSAHPGEVRASKPVQGSPGILARRVPPDASVHPWRSHLLDQHRCVAAGTLDALHITNEARSMPKPNYAKRPGFVELCGFERSHE
ncbi:conserved hypothetical protein [Mesorhizobium ventifaucium]|uniref:Uncharacterized protein n=1 Tax=Mesorhizobium ventifaucium TaxID=666020 RepID=A0ABN8JRA8_9HYPH|nr:conserved hypothetical protein [Mesorhizobium ventifaucium]